MILARVAVAKSSRSAASSEDLSGTFYRACRKTAPRTGAVSSLSDLCSPHDAYAPCPLLAGQRLASHRLRLSCHRHRWHCTLAEPRVDGPQLAPGVRALAVARRADHTLQGLLHLRLRPSCRVDRARD